MTDVALTSAAGNGAARKTRPFLKLVDPDDEIGELWQNRTYHVVMRELAAWDGRSLVHLAVSRHDRRPARDWRHLQRIKNQLVGAECEAVELFPAESRLVGTCNVTHLWCATDPAYCFPFGYEDRRRRARRPTPVHLRPDQPPARAGGLRRQQTEDNRHARDLLAEGADEPGGDREPALGARRDRRR
jgi:hypothetical protein